MFDAGGYGPSLLAVLASVFTGFGTTMLAGAVIAVAASRAGDDPRAARAIALVPWSGTAGTAVGAMMPVAVWLATHL